MSKQSRLTILSKLYREMKGLAGLNKAEATAYSDLSFKQRLRVFSGKAKNKLFAAKMVEVPLPPALETSLTYSPLFKDLNAEDFLKYLEPHIERQLSTVDLAEKAQISIITPTYNSSLDWFIETAISVLQQSSSAWEWCLVDDGSSKTDIRNILTHLAEKHPRIKVELRSPHGISAATNRAVELASAPYICFLDHDDTLSPDAIAVSLSKLAEGFDLTYSDEDKIDASGLYYVEPFFKPDWSLEYLRGVMYVGHLLCVRKALVEDIGGFDSAYDGIQDYEMVLRLAETYPKVGHICQTLYHWRKVVGSISADSQAKGKIDHLQEAAVNAHLRRLNLPATAQSLGSHRIGVFPSDKQTYPLISIIIPTRDAPHHLERCLSSLFQLTNYPNFEVVVVDNDTTDPQALALMREYPVRRIFLPNPFNYSRANNLGCHHARGDYLVFLNNDTEIVHPDWLQQLLYYAEQPDIGAVGALLLFPDRTVQHAGVVLGFRGTADHVMRGFPADVDGYAGSLTCTREVSAVTAACLMLSVQDFKQIDGFNEHYFHHYQDVDLCFKLLELGKRNVFTPRAVLIHHESATRKSYYDLLDRYLLLDQWEDAITCGDPYFNPNFTLDRCDYTVRV